MWWLARYLAEGSPRLKHFAEVTASLAKRELGRAEIAHGRNEGWPRWAKPRSLRYFPDQLLPPLQPFSNSLQGSRDQE